MLKLLKELQLINRYERHFNYFNEDFVILENEAYIDIFEEDPFRK